MKNIEVKSHLSEQVESKAGGNQSEEVAHCEFAHNLLANSHRWDPRFRTTTPNPVKQIDRRGLLHQSKPCKLTFAT